MPLPIVAAALTALPGIISKIGDLLKKPDPKAAFDSAVIDAQKQARTNEEKARVESLRLQGLQLMREWYSQQDPNNPPLSVAKWGQAGVDNYRANIEKAKQELNGNGNAFSGNTAPGITTPFGYTPTAPGGSPITVNFLGDLMSGPKSWGIGQWGLIAVLAFLFTPLKKIFK